MTLFDIVILGYIVNITYMVSMFVIGFALGIYHAFTDIVQTQKSLLVLEKQKAQYEELVKEAKEKKISIFSQDDLTLLMPYTGILKFLIDTWQIASVGLFESTHIQYQKRIDRLESRLKDV